MPPGERIGVLAIDDILRCEKDIQSAVRAKLPVAIDRRAETDIFKLAILSRAIRQVG